MSRQRDVMVTPVSGGTPREPAEAADDRARDRAALYRLVSWLLLENPDERFVEELLGGETERALSSSGLATERTTAGIAEMRVAVAGAGLEITTICRDLAVQRTRLFRGVAPGYGPRPPYEATYRSAEVTAQAETLLRLEQLYGEAGVAVLPDRVERLDYLGLELELMAVLCEEEGDRRAEGNAGSASWARALQVQLLTEHLLRWVPPYCEALLKEEGVPFYHGAARVLSGLLSYEAERLEGTS